MLIVGVPVIQLLLLIIYGYACSTSLSINIPKFCIFHRINSTVLGTSPVQSSSSVAVAPTHNAKVRHVTINKLLYTCFRDKFRWDTLTPTDDD